MNIQQVKLVAHYEIKQLRRNWLFRLLLLTSIIGISLTHVLLQGEAARHDMIALPCSIPFVNAYLFNLLQSLMIIFIAGDFLIRDRQLDTLNALQVHPINNIEYFMGKTLGIGTIFISINLLILFLAIGFHVFFSYSPFALYPYAFYLFTLTIPSLIFMIGLTLCMNNIIKTQGLTILLLLGFLVGDTTYLSEIKHGAFDFLAITLPNTFSDMTGHVNLWPYTIQRSTFLLSGLALIILAISLSKRSFNHTKSLPHLRTIGISIAALSILLCGSFQHIFIKQDQKREYYKTIYTKYHSYPKIHVANQEITYKQQKDQIMVNSQLTIINETPEATSRILLYLNPSLQVTAVQESGHNIPYQREAQAILVNRPLPSGKSLSLTIKYQGIIDESICYPDINDRTRYATQWSNNILRFGKRYALVSPTFTLLTPECLWYPTSIPPVNPHTPYSTDKDFCLYTLNISHDTAYSAISQGSPTISSPGHTRFINHQSLPGVTLCIGLYMRDTITVDETLFEIHSFKHHPSFIAPFDGSRKGVHRGIKRSKEQYEQINGKPYPFRKLALIEIPVAFTSYTRQGGKNSEYIQPELILQPENWCKNSYHITLQRSIRSARQWRPNQTDEETEENHIVQFCWEHFQPQSEIHSGNQLVNTIWEQYSALPIANPFSIAPLFSNFTRLFYSSEYPGIDRIVNAIFLNDEVLPNIDSRGNNTYHLASTYLSTHSLNDALHSNPHPELTESIIKLKGNYLQKLLSTRVPLQQFQTFLQNYCNRNQFKKIPFDNLLQEIKDSLHLDLSSDIQQLYNAHAIPTYKIQNLRILVTEQNEQTTSFADGDVWNTSPTNGIISLYAEHITQRGAKTKYIKSMPIAANEKVHISIPLENNARDIKIETNISRNIPSYFISKIREKSIPGGNSPERTPVDSSRFQTSSDEIIVDNENQNCQIIETDSKNIFRSNLHSKQDYKSNIDILTSSGNRWMASISNEAHGHPIRSFLIKAAQNSNSRVEWETTIQEDGTYDLFIHHVELGMLLQDHHPLTSYSYSINQQEFKGDVIINMGVMGKTNILRHDNSGFQEEITFDTYTRSGWIPLGSYQLKHGEVKVTLHDKGAFPKQLLFADAIKWVKQK